VVKVNYENNTKTRLFIWFFFVCNAGRSAIRHAAGVGKTAKPVTEGVTIFDKENGGKGRSGGGGGGGGGGGSFSVASVRLLTSIGSGGDRQKACCLLL
jgi:uncharacterized membrane protein YgcG